MSGLSAFPLRYRSYPSIPVIQLPCVAMARVQIVEDSSDIAELIRHYLTRAGYDTTVQRRAAMR